MVAPRGICGISNATEINLLRGLLILKFAESGSRCEKDIGIVFQIVRKRFFRDCCLLLKMASNDEILNPYHPSTNFN